MGKCFVDGALGDLAEGDASDLVGVQPGVLRDVPGDGFTLTIKVGGQPVGCEVFYEIQLRFIDPNPGNPALPPAKIVTMVFSASEDLLSDPARAIFGLPVGAMVLSPARNVAREAFLREYFRASWRVRAVNGANQVSPWSPFITQGPASAGVPA